MLSKVLLSSGPLMKYPLWPNQEKRKLYKILGIRKRRIWSKHIIIFHINIIYTRLSLITSCLEKKFGIFLFYAWKNLHWLKKIWPQVWFTLVETTLIYFSIYALKSLSKKSPWWTNLIYEKFGGLFKLLYHSYNLVTTDISQLTQNTISSKIVKNYHGANSERACTPWSEIIIYKSYKQLLIFPSYFLCRLFTYMLSVYLAHRRSKWFWFKSYLSYRKFKVNLNLFCNQGNFYVEFPKDLF